MIALQIVGGWLGIGALVSLAVMVIDRVVKPNDVPLFNWWGYAFFVVFWPGLILLIWRTLYAPRPTCAYCGAKFESMDEAPAHLAVCEKHPMRELEAEIERLRVQLCGCSVAALGHKEKVNPGDYGWSASYQDVVTLRERMEKAEAASARSGPDARDGWSETLKKGERSATAS